MIRRIWEIWNIRENKADKLINQSKKIQATIITSNEIRTKSNIVQKGRNEK